MYMRPAAELQLGAAAPVAGGAPPRDAMLQASVVLSLAVVVGSFIAVEPLIHIAKLAAESLPF
jgi:L-cystine uptake protein TcyP (sodium:dicarboxylate symporter family)